MIRFPVEIGEMGEPFEAIAARPTGHRSGVPPFWFAPRIGVLVPSVAA
jgi:hypothetical protein